MTKTALKNFTTKIARRRRELTRLREDIEDLLDYLEVRERKALFDRRSETRAGYLSRGDPVANTRNKVRSFYP